MFVSLYILFCSCFVFFFCPFRCQNSLFIFDELTIHYINESVYWTSFHSHSIQNILWFNQWSKELSDKFDGNMRIFLSFFSSLIPRTFYVCVFCLVFVLLCFSYHCPFLARSYFMRKDRWYNFHVFP